MKKASRIKKFKRAEDFLPQKPWFRIDEVAVYFGLSRKTIRNYINQGRLRSAKVGGGIKIPRESILAFPVEVKYGD